MASFTCAQMQQT